MASARKGRPVKKIEGDHQTAASRGRCLKEIRSKLEWTQTEMSVYLGWSKDQISKMERANIGREIDDRQLTKIINYFRDKKKFDEFKIDALYEEIQQILKTIPLPELTILNNLPDIHTDFEGRTTEIAQLLENLSPDSETMRLDITGIGGVGKSALAIEVAKSCQKLHYFDAIIRYSANKQQNEAKKTPQHECVNTALIDLLICIIKVINPEYLEPHIPEAQLIINTQELLSSIKTLLIIDSFENVIEEQILAFLKNIPKPSKVLAIGRGDTLSTNTIKLLELPEEECIKIIQNICFKHKFDLDEQEQKQITIETGGIPFAIVWTLYNIHQKNGLSTNYI